MLGDTSKQDQAEVQLDDVEEFDVSVVNTGSTLHHQVEIDGNDANKSFQVLENPSGDSNGDDQVQENKEDKKVAPITNLYATVYAFNMFTITDGAIRVIILLHLNNLGFTPIQIALVFVLYEIAGVFTNLFGGVAATRYGLKVTLFSSLVCQIVGLILLLLVNPIFGEPYKGMPDDVKMQVTAYVTICQALAGVAKDLMKVSCKSVPKLVTKADDNDALFRLVAWVTGLKNTWKGLGHLLGAVMIQFLPYEVAIAILLVVIVLIVPVAAFMMDRDIGKGRKTKVFSWEVLKKPWNVNILSFARMFLFASRDVWFEIAAPIFLANVLGWPKFTIGLFMGGYIILYGNIQTSTTKLYKKTKKQAATTTTTNNKVRRCHAFQGPPTEKHVPSWAFANAAQILIWGIVLYPLYREYINEGENGTYQIVLSTILIVGLVFFAFFFAVNSSVHSYLIVLYSDGDKAAMDLGFYYMANAAGRLVGTILGGVIFQYSEDQFGLSMCLWVATIFMFLAGVVAFKLKPLDPKTDPKTEDVLP